MNIDGVIFDLDGTLIDSTTAWKTLPSDYLRSRGLTPLTDVDEELKDLSMKQAAEIIRDKYEPQRTADEITADIIDMMSGFYRDRVQLKPGAERLLQMLKERGIPMCVATASDITMAENAMRRNGIIEYFDGVFTTAQAGCGKDRPDVYDMARAHMGTRAGRTAVFEDALYAIKTAKAAGYTVIAVYDPYESASKQQVALAADIYLDSLEDAEVVFK